MRILRKTDNSKKKNEKNDLFSTNDFVFQMSKIVETRLFHLNFLILKH